MRRALQLARNGEGRVSPNPMVGAVIVHGDRIIGEGFHANYGEAHAEVNAINSVKESDRELLKDSKIYVTLEPCAHYGKTPPCANLIVDSGIRDVVIGSLDPNPLVAGKGVKILTDAGVSVKVGILENDCMELNRRFMKAQMSDIPWITLKWAQSKDGFLGGYNKTGDMIPVKFSSPVSSVWVHRERALSDAIMIGGNTERTDHPRLDNRLWGGNSPKKVVAHFNKDIKTQLKELRKEGITSLLVEGGASLLQYFLDNDLYDEIRVETNPACLNDGVRTPKMPSHLIRIANERCGDNYVETFRR